MRVNVKEILTGWSNFIFKTPEVEKMALERLEICLTCPENSSQPELTILSTCKKCGCVLSAKSRNEESKCPLKKW